MWPSWVRLKGASGCRILHGGVLIDLQEGMWVTLLTLLLRPLSSSSFSTRPFPTTLTPLNSHFAPLSLPYRQSAARAGHVVGAAAHQGQHRHLHHSHHHCPPHSAPTRRREARANGPTPRNHRHRLPTSDWAALCSSRSRHENWAEVWRSGAGSGLLPPWTGGGHTGWLAA